MPENCGYWHGVIAERALHGLDAETERGVSEHLNGCAAARALADEFAATAAALSHARPERVESISTSTSTSAPAPSPERLYGQIATQLAAGRTRKRRRWVIGLSAAAVLVGIFVAAAVVSAPTRTGSQPVAIANDIVDGAVTFVNHSWGTEIHLQATGFTPGQQYNVWMERADGTRVAAGTFTGTTGARVSVTLASALAQSHAVAIGISQPDGKLVVRAPLT
jgi:hypothetical protein